MNIKQLVNRLSLRARAKRITFFRSIFLLRPGLKILDLGSESGSAIAMVLEGSQVENSNVYIADISKEMVSLGEKRFGFHGVLIPESGVLPFPDKYFDIVYCSSVIEHVTVNKDEVWSVKSDEEFRVRSSVHQELFANEIRRLGRAYFVQTPNRGFLIESHSWLPFVGCLPRPLLIQLLSATNRFWIKQTSPDFNLLTSSDLITLFPGATIVKEKVFGFTKSLMAVNGDNDLLEMRQRFS